MFVDVLTRVSNSQQVTADAVSTSSIDNGNVTPKRVIGDGEPIGFAVAIVAAGTNSGSMVIQAIASAAADLGSGTVVCGEIDLVTADLAAGNLFFVPVAPTWPRLRYIGLNYDVTSTVDVTCTAWLTLRSMFANIALSYAKGYTIS